MSKIALLATNLAGSGAEKVVLNLARMFESHGNEVHIFLLENVISYNTDGLKIHTLSKRRDIYKALKGVGDRILAHKLRKRMRSLINEGDVFDLVLSNLPSADRVASVAELQNTYYLIHTSYSMELQEFRQKRKYQRAKKKEKLYRTLYNDKNLIAVSEGIQKDLDEMEITYRSCSVIYNPFDIEKIQTEADNAVYDIPKPYLLSASAFRPVKRYDILLEAYSLLNDPPPLKLLCNSSNELKQLIERFKIEDKVEILGFTKNPYPIIRQAEVLILSSEREGLPTVLIESLILHTPIVSTDCISGPNEIMTGELKQYLAKVNDSEDLSEKIAMALKCYPEIDDQMFVQFREDRIYHEYCKIVKQCKDKI